MNNNVDYHKDLKNLIAFWIFGLCNNFVYVVMLSAAEDILGKGTHNETFDKDLCIEKPENITCSQISTGAVLLADIIPSFIVKLLTPFFFNSVSYTVRHGFVVFFQISSFLIVAFSNNFTLGLIGVIFASVGCGLGEVSYLSLSSHFHSDVVSSWSSGTGGAGLAGALAFSVLTDHRFLALTSSTALLLMLVVPLILLLTFWKILVFPPTIKSFNFNRYCCQNFYQSIQSHDDDLISNVYSDNQTFDSNYEADQETFLLLSNNDLNNNSDLEQSTTIISQNKISEAILNRLSIIRPLIKYMIPLFLVFYAEYFINQGLVEFLTFTCLQGFYLSPSSQYRWYQVFYQLGVFISRSSVKWFPLNASFLPFLALLQLINAALLYEDALKSFLSHIIIVFIIIFYEGLIGGAIYVNTFKILHKTVQNHREFRMGFVALADTLGIVFAGITSIWVHNHICLKNKFT